jgi:hypothetical protein
MNAKEIQTALFVANWKMLDHIPFLMYTCYICEQWSVGHFGPLATKW